FVVVGKRRRGLRTEVEEEGARAHARRGGDVLDRRVVEAALGEEPEGLDGERLPGGGSPELALAQSSPFTAARWADGRTLDTRPSGVLSAVTVTNAIRPGR